MTDANPTRSLAELRALIRTLDDQLLGIVANRQALAREVGAVKHAAALPIKDYRVEKDVVASAKNRALGLGLEPELAEKLTRLMIEYSVQAQDELHQEKKRSARAAPKEKVLIAGGRGRMGLWLTDFFESFGHEVSHFDVTPRGVASSGAQTNPLVSDWGKAVNDAGIIALATPISATSALIEDLTQRRSDALIFDICSLKTPLEPALFAAAAAGLKITSTHPMFGPSARVLAGRNLLILNISDAPNARAAAAAAGELFAETTANVIHLPLAKHDPLMSFVLGLSHMTSLVFADALQTSGAAFADLARVASTTFNAQLDVTRAVASEHQDLYYEIQAENAHSPVVIAAMEQALATYAEAIAKKDRVAFRKAMERGRRFLNGDA